MKSDNQQGILEKYGINYLYHITDIDNLQSILLRGILSHQYIQSQNFSYTDISDSQVQQLRSKKKIEDIPLHQYVPLYFNPKNPMLFVRRHRQSRLIIIGIDPLILFQPNTIFSDGNAACENTLFYQDLNHLSCLNWRIIRQNSSWSNQPDGKRIRCAEVLVYPKISISRILKIFCYSQQILTQIKNMGCNQPIEINSNLYF